MLIPREHLPHTLAPAPLETLLGFLSVAEATIALSHRLIDGRPGLTPFARSHMKDAMRLLENEVFFLAPR